MATYSSIPPDLDEEITQYRWDPLYTMVHVGTDTMFRPTGGVLLFRLIPPVDNLKRKILGRECKDIVSLDELVAILSNINKRDKAVEMYRPLLVDKETNRISLQKLVNNIRLFGVTSINQCREWHKDFMTTVQPVLIYGSCHVDKTDYTKQDTLRLPVSMCDVDKGRPEDTRHFVYFTFSSENGGDWMPKFIITPNHAYVNEHMMELEGMSLVYPIGIVDYLNEGGDSTSIYMYKPSQLSSRSAIEEPMWFVEGFVFNPNGRWRLQYDGAPREFYQGTFHGFEDGWRMLEHDPSKNAILHYLFKREINYNNSPSTDDETCPPIGSQRRDSQSSTSTSLYPEGSKAPPWIRFYGGGRLGEASFGGSDISLDGSNENLDVNPLDGPSAMRNMATPHLNNLNTRLSFSLDTSKNPRRVNFNIQRKITEPFRNAVSKFFRRLNAYVEANMKNRARIELGRLSPGESLTVSAKDTFLILAMSFLGRLKITLLSGGSTRAVTEAREQISMDKLFSMGQIEKLTCLVNYFVKGLTGKAFLQGRNLSFFHKAMTNVVPYHSAMVGPDLIEAVGLGIEDRGRAMADFANKRFGGGVMGGGAVQEEILLIIHPEALLGRALFEQMTDKSACVVMGALRFSNYTGYGRGGGGATPFTYAGTLEINTKQALDVERRALTEIVAMDAKDYKGFVQAQYSRCNIVRDFIKAFVAFDPIPSPDDTVLPFTAGIATGRWGSGDFKGDPLLKVLIQIAAGSAAGRPLILVKLGWVVANAVFNIMNQVLTAKMTVGDFLKIIIDATTSYNYGSDPIANSAITERLILDQLAEIGAIPPSPLTGSELLQLPIMGYGDEGENLEGGEAQYTDGPIVKKRRKRKGVNLTT